MTFRYYLSRRQPSIGTHPKNALIVVGFNERQESPILHHGYWGYVEYDHELLSNELYNYELFVDEIPQSPEIQQIIAFTRDNGIDETIEYLKTDKDIVTILTKYLKSIGIKTGSLENYKMGLLKISGVHL